MNPRPHLPRREWIKRALLLAAAVPLLKLFRVTEAEAAPSALEIDPKTNPNPTATSLGYVQDSTKVDKAKYPKHTNDQQCGNCMLFTADADKAFGKCQLFPGSTVRTKGWCSAFVKKP